MIGSAWSKTFDEAARVLFAVKESRGKVEGYWWIDLAKSYMHAQADILADAMASMRNLNTDLQVLISQFDRDVKPTIDKYGS